MEAFYDFDKALKNTISVGQNFVVPESDYLEPLATKRHISTLVVQVIVGMLSAVDFYYESRA